MGIQVTDDVVRFVEDSRDVRVDEQRKLGLSSEKRPSGRKRSPPFGVGLTSTVKSNIETASRTFRQKGQPSYS